jgi:hypothetical protein
VVVYSKECPNVCQEREIMVFGDIFKNVQKELEKGVGDQQQREREQQKQKEDRERYEEKPHEGGYERLTAWIKTRYGNRFRDGQKNVEVESQLESIFKEREAKGDFKKHPKIANGFRIYIDQKKYGDLVKVSQ